MFISHKKEAVLIFIVFQLFLSSFIFSDPFTAGSNGTLRPAASRSSFIALPEGFNNLQFEIREKSADILDSFRANPTPLSILLFSLAVFLYGILHGAGPGHRKTIVFTLFLSRPARKWEPLAAGFLSAGLHAGSSLVLFIFFNLIWQSVSTFSDSENIAFYLEGWTFIALATGAVILIVIKIVSIVSHKNNQLPQKSGKNIYLLLIASSMFPCPGATMLLILALSQQLIYMGIIGVLAMSFGMGVIISLAGYLGMAGRDRVFSWFKEREGIVQRVTNIFELLSYSVVALFSLWMGSPFIFWLIKGI